MDELEIKDLKDKPARKIYPSVCCGPVNVNKAISQLGFIPTTLVSILV